MRKVFAAVCSYFLQSLVALIFLVNAGCSLSVQLYNRYVSSNSSFQVVPNSGDFTAGSTLKVSAENGTPPYTFERVSGNGSVAADGTVTVLAAGEAITIKGTDSVGRVALATFNAFEKPEILPSTKMLTVQNTFPFAVAGGKPPYSFGIASGDGQISSAGLFTAPTTPQSVVIEVVDSLGGKGQASINVVAALQIIPSEVAMSIHGNKNFGVVGGVPPIQWEIESGEGSFDSGLGVFHAPGSSGTAVIKATDSLGNEARAFVQINDELLINPPLLELATNSIFNFKASGGVPPYSFQLKSGTGSVSAAGVYTAPATVGEAEVLVTDADGATATSKVLINLSLSFIFPNITMLVNETKDLSLNVIGGTPPLTFTVSPQAGVINAASGVFTAGTVIGNFEATVTDSQGHQAKASITIEPPVEISPINPIMMALTELAFSAQGGIPPYTFSIVLGEGSFVETIFTAPAVAQAVTVKVTDSAGHFATTVVQVREPLVILPATISLLTNATQIFTAEGGLPPYSFALLSGGGSVEADSGLFTAPPVNGTSVVVVEDSDGNTAQAFIEIFEPIKITPAHMAVLKENTLSVLASGGKVPYKFSIISGSGSIDEQTGLFQATQELGKVVVRATDSLGNFAEGEIQVYDQLLIDPVQSEIVVEESISFTASGGQEPYRYSILSGEESGSLDSDTGLFVATTTAGTVKVQVIDALGATSDATLIVSPSLVIEPSTVTLTTDSTEQFKATGGTSPYEYSIVSGAGELSTAGLFTAPAVSGVTVVQVTDAGGRTADATVTINGALTVVPEAADLLYNQSQIYTVSGGIGSYTYSLVSGPGTIDGAGNFTAGTTSGRATLRITDSLGVAVQAEANIVEPLEISPTEKDLDLSSKLTFKALKGLPPYAFQVLTGGGTIQSSGLYESPSSAGTSTIQVTDALGQTAVATVNTFEELQVVPGLVSILSGETQVVSATGGFGAYTFTLLSGSGSFLDSPPRYIAGASSEVAKVQVVDGLGNFAIGTINVVPPVTITPSTLTLAVGEKQTFAAVGGSSPYVFSIVSGGGTIEASGLFTAGMTPESVVIRVTDSLNQFADVSVTVIPALEISPVQSHLKFAGTQTFTATGGQGPYSYSVKVPGLGSIGSVSGDYIAPNLETTESVEVTDALGKKAVATVRVYGPVQISPTTKNLTPGSTFTFNASGGMPPYNYGVSTGGGTITSAGVLTAGADGNYTVRVVDSLGQISDAVINVAPLLELLPTNSTIVTGSTQALSLTGGIAPYTFSFTGGGSFDEVNLIYSAPTVPAAATVTVTDSVGNTSTANISTVAGPPAALAFTTDAQTVVAGACSAAANIKLQDSYGNDTAAVSSVTVNLSADKLTFYSDSTCSTPVTSREIPIAATGTAIYFKGVETGLQMITATATGLSMATHTENLISGTATILNLTTSPQTIKAGQCSGVVQFDIRDAYNNLASLSSNKTISLSPAGLKFYLAADCSGTSVTALALTTGASSGLFYFKSTLANTYDLRLTSAGFTSTNQSAIVTPADPDVLSFTTQPSSLMATNTVFDTQPVVTVSDLYGNIVDDRNLSVNLSASADVNCTGSAPGALSATSNPLVTSTGIASFSGVKFDTNGTIYLKATVGSASACSEAVVINGNLESLLTSGASIVPSDGLAETTLLVVPRDNGNKVGAGKVVEFSFNSTDVTVTGAGACRTPSATCVKAVDQGQGAYTVIAKSAVPGVYEFTAVVAGSPDLAVPGTVSVIFNTASFTVISATTTLTSADAGKNLYITAGTTTFDSSTVGQSFGEVFIRGGTVVHPATTATVVNHLEINVGSLTVMSGSINANNLGYTSGKSYSSTGPSSAIASTSNSGGSHGGQGGGVATTKASGATYGDYRNPALPGGGAPAVGAGGGVIRIVAANLCTVNSAAKISANGAANYGGAGGSIYLKCGGFAGTAGTSAITANGGSASSSGYGAGGGGRIAMISTGDESSWLDAIKYPLGATNLTAFKSAVKAIGGSPYSQYHAGGAGTIYVANSLSVHGDLIVDNNGVLIDFMSGETLLLSLSGTASGAITATNIPVTIENGILNSNYLNVYKSVRLRNLNDNKGTPDDWTDDPIVSLTGNTETELLAQGTSGFQNGDTVRSIDIFDHVDFSNSAIIRSHGDVVALAGTLDSPVGPVNFNNAFLNFSGSASVSPAINSLSYSSGTYAVASLQGANIVVSGASLTSTVLISTNSLQLTAGTLIAEDVNVTNQFLISGGVMKHPATSASKVNKLQIFTGSLVMNGGAIDVSGLGYLSRTSYSATGSSGALKSAGQYTGASHGGQGGLGASGGGIAGATYGDYRNPSLPGAGSDVHTGGGVVRITATNLCTINSGAKIAANGAVRSGAGGSIYLNCAGFAGTAGADSITANGGDGGTSNGGGGGGRIAMISTSDATAWTGSFAYPVGAVNLGSFKSVVRALGGTVSGSAGVGGAGTVYLKNLNSVYGDLIVDNGSLVNNSKTGTTFLVSLAGTVNGAVTGTSVPLNAVNGSMGTGYVDIYKSIRFRSLASDQGTPNNWIDDAIFIADGNTAAEITAPSTTGFANGDSVRSIDIFDHIDIAGNALLNSHGDIVTLNGTLTNPNSTVDLVNATMSFTGEAKLWPTLNSLTFSSGTFDISSLSGKDITVSGASLTTANLEVTNNLKVTAGTLTGNQINVANQFWITGGLIKHPPTDASVVHKLEITTGSFLMDGGSINVNGLGYPSGRSYSATGPSTALASSGQYTGASHAGGGGLGSSGGTPGATYGDYKNPAHPGAGAYSKAGGGVVRINATNLCTVNSGASISAQGIAEGGAGGSIYLSCSGFAGTAGIGAISVSGGAGSTSNGGGGGGRIALISSGNASAWTASFVYPTGASFVSNFKSAVKAQGGAGVSNSGSGAAGTIYLRNADSVHGDLLIDNGGIATNAKVGTTVLVSFSGSINGDPTATDIPVSVVNGSLGVNYVDLYKGVQVRNLANDNGTPNNWIDDPRKTLLGNTATQLVTTSTLGFSNGNPVRSIDIVDHLEVSGNAQVSSHGDLVTTGGTLSNPGSTVDLTNSVLAFTGSASLWPSLESMTFTSGTVITSSLVGKNIIISGATVTVPTITASNNLKIESGIITSQNINVSNQFWMTGGTVTHPATDATNIYSLNINTGDLLLEGGSINVVGLGYLAGRGYAASGSSALVASKTTTGGSHGGQGGGGSSTFNPGITYGDYKNPAYPGGGASTSSAGGGVVRITATNLCTVNSGATINTNGQASYGGAGGSIYMKCAGFSGSAAGDAITARGGASTSSYGGGGGGRIAMISTGDTSSWSGSFNYPSSAVTLSNFKSVVKATGGTSVTYSGGAAGTIYLAHSGSVNGDLIIDNGGISVGAKAGSTRFVASTANSSVVTSSTATSLVVGATAQFTNLEDLFKNYRVHVFPSDLGPSADPRDASHLEIVITSNSTSALIAASENFPDFSSYFYRFVHKLDRLDVSGNAQVDLYGADLLLTSTAGACDLHSSNAGYLDVPAGSSVTGGNSLSSGYCSSSGLSGSWSFVNNFLQ